MEMPSFKDFSKNILNAHKTLIEAAWSEWLALSDKDRDANGDGFKTFLTKYIDRLIEQQSL